MDNGRQPATIGSSTVAVLAHMARHSDARFDWGGAHGRVVYDFINRCSARSTDEATSGKKMIGTIVRDLGLGVQLAVYGLSIGKAGMVQEPRLEQITSKARRWALL